MAIYVPASRRRRSLLLSSIGVELPLAEVFDRVDFMVEESDETPAVSEPRPV